MRLHTAEIAEGEWRLTAERKEFWERKFDAEVCRRLLTAVVTESEWIMTAE